MKNHNIGLIQMVVFLLFLFSSCNSKNNNSTTSSANIQNFDSCSIAKHFENAELTEMMVKPGYTGVLNNYWGTDSTKLDFRHFFENGKIVKSIFYYENGKPQEEYTYKCSALNGMQKYFYENGKLSKIIPFSYGYRQGTGELYDEKGTLRQQVNFVADSLTGEPKNFDEKGKPIVQSNTNYPIPRIFLRGNCCCFN